MKHFFLLILLAAVSFACHTQDENPVTPTDQPPAGITYDWEGPVAVYNTAYNDSIVFTSDRCLGTGFIPSVHIMHKNGTGMRALTTRWITFGATWSPRRWKVIYIADTAFSDGGVYTMDANGANNRRLTPPGMFPIAAACSPDGKKIAYIVLNSINQGKLRLMNVDGTGAVDLTSWFGHSDINTITWTSDSKRIIFDGYSLDGKDGIGVIDAAGGAVRKLFDYPYQCCFCSLSPDNKTLAFSSFAKVDSNYYSNIFLFTMANGQITQLTKTAGFDYHPSWSQDGQYLVYNSQAPGLHIIDHLFRVKADGSSTIQLTSGEYNDINPCWFN